MPRLAIIDHAVSAGGVERFLHGLVDGLKELPEAGEWEITLLLAKRNSGGFEVVWPDYLLAPNITQEYLPEHLVRKVFDRLGAPKRVWGIPGTWKAKRIIRDYLVKHYPTQLAGYTGDVGAWIQRYCRRRRLDVAYFSYPYFMRCPELKMPMVCTPHDFNYLKFDGWEPEVRDRLDSDMRQWLERSYRAVVSSEFIAGELKRYYPQWADKVRVVRLGIPTSERTPSQSDLEALRKEIGLPERFLLTVGWIIPHKNQKVVFRALGELKRRGEDIGLVCIGPNSDHIRHGKDADILFYVKEALEIAESLDLEHERDFWGLGYVSDFHLECLYRLATALVVPSLYEAGSFPAREAMLAGCPVVWSRIPSLLEESELIEGNVWMFDPHDHTELADLISGMLANPGEVKEKARRAEAVVRERFSWRKTAEQYLKICEEAIGNR